MSNEQFTLDGCTYCESDLPASAIDIFKLLKFTTLTLDSLKNKKSVILRAKNGYIEDLKLEIIEQKSGINLGSLFDEN